MSFTIQPDSASFTDLISQSGLSSSLLFPARIDPVTKTANFSVIEGFDVYTCGAAAGITVTLPSYSLFPGRVLHFKNVTAQTLSSNIDIFTATGTSDVSILAATAGNSSTLVSDGARWVNVRRSVV